MLNAATMTMIVTMRNMTLRWTWSAPKKVVLSCRQSMIAIGRAAALDHEPAEAVDLVRIGDVDRNRGDVVGAAEIGLRLGAAA